MNELIEWLTGIPVICLIGLCYAFAILLLPIGQLIEYKMLCKKCGKEEADEIMRRF